jgi:poly-gamma-glutamate capsule biosynthesis protein CapA/YwtB (metallophosphatase superfamily)
MKRRDFLGYSALTSLAIPGLCDGVATMSQTAQGNQHLAGAATLFVAGDVMTGRAIDQALPHPGDPRIHEPYSQSALDYVRLAERANGPIARPVDFAYIWGDALAALEQAAPDVRIVNLETAVTARGTPWPGKGIQYRMHPDNIPCLTAADIDCCVLANNHVLDWGYPGLDETLDSLARAGLRMAGAGSNQAAAQAPAALLLTDGGRVLVFACGVHSSGIPGAWAATANRAGVNLLTDLSDTTVSRIADSVRADKRPGDLVVVSIHWGGNWGYTVPASHTRFARALIDKAGVDLVHGHSSHHPIGIEVYRGKPILYGCGDLIDDYEGIGGYAQFRSDLTLLYLVTLNRSNGALLRLVMLPMRMQRFRLNHAASEEAAWLAKVMNRESQRFAATVQLAGDGSLRLGWQ